MRLFPSENRGDDSNIRDIWHDECDAGLREAWRIAGEIEEIRSALVELRIPEWVSDFPHIDTREEADALEQQLVSLADDLCFEMGRVFAPFVENSAVYTEFMRTLIRIDNVIEGPATSSKMSVILSRETLPPDQKAA
tara:strand:- start:355 stop:765 length:411 start_codon:yes stop_codon:yes gene_type:complete